jgi:hypothetical protein
MRGFGSNLWSEDWGSHSRDCKQFCLLRCSALQFVEVQRRFGASHCLHLLLYAYFMLVSCLDFSLEDVPPKLKLTFTRLHAVISQKIEFRYIVTGYWLHTAFEFIILFVGCSIFLSTTNNCSSCVLLHNRRVRIAHSEFFFVCCIFAYSLLSCGLHLQRMSPMFRVRRLSSDVEHSSNLLLVFASIVVLCIRTYHGNSVDYKWLTFWYMASYSPRGRVGLSEKAPLLLYRNCCLGSGSNKLLLILSSTVILGSTCLGTRVHMFVSRDGGSRTALPFDWFFDLLTGRLLLTIASAVILCSESHGTHDHILLSDGSGSLQTVSQPLPPSDSRHLSLSTFGEDRFWRFSDFSYSYCNVLYIMSVFCWAKPQYLAHQDNLKMAVCLPFSSFCITWRTNIIRKGPLCGNVSSVLRTIGALSYRNSHT